MKYLAAHLIGGNMEFTIIIPAILGAMVITFLILRDEKNK
jgi:hypothetical protein